MMQKIQECDQVQQINIDKSLKRYKSSAIAKKYTKHSPFWGYTMNE